MNKRTNHITVFEHEIIKVGREYDGVEFEQHHLASLEKFYGEKGVVYYDLVNKGIKIKEYVGALQVGNLTIQVLPKADKYNEKDDWQNILINMLKSVGAFESKAPSFSSLSLKHNYILDLYFELFVNDVEYLFNKGLIKKYRKTEGNRLTLKGSLLFGKHIQHNLVHQERFYVKDSTYDKDHKLHQILYKTLLLLKRINSNQKLKSRIGNLLLNFPEQNNIAVTDATFNKITLNRKTEVYKSALDISRLLLLNYHPDLSKGKNDVLALMFNMNALWETFIYVSLRKKLPENWNITAQIKKNFWRKEGGGLSYMKPDIVITCNNGDTMVIDTKWKNIGNSTPSSSDLRQMYVYHEYFKASKVALVYPGDGNINSGEFYKTGDSNSLSDKKCSIIKIPTNKTISKWQENISTQIFDEWIGTKN